MMLTYVQVVALLLLGSVCTSYAADGIEKYASKQTVSTTDPGVVKAGHVLPSDIGAQRDNSQERNKKRTNQNLPKETKRGNQFPPHYFYFSTQKKQRKICAICESLIKVSSSDCSNNLNGATDICRNYAIEKPDVVGTLWYQHSFEEEEPQNEAGFPAEPYNYFDTPMKLRKICMICMMQFNHSSFDCYEDRKGARASCERMVYEMPNSIGRMWNLHTYEVKRNMQRVRRNLPTEAKRGMQYPTRAYYFDSPRRRRRICAICESLFNVSSSDCSNNLNEANDECKRYVTEKRDVVVRIWNQHSFEEEEPQNEAGFPVEPYNYFDTPTKLRKICLICMMIFKDLSAYACYENQKGARDRCELLVFEMPIAFGRMWNVHTYEVN